MLRPSDPISTKIITDAHIELLRGRRQPPLRPSARTN
jgi:hypothetical protein